MSGLQEAGEKENTAPPEKRPRINEELDETSPTRKRPRTDAMKDSESLMTEKELSRGAEGLVTRFPFFGRPAIRKERFPKRYRHPELDAKLTARRIQQEARILLRLRKNGVRVPAVYSVDAKKALLVLEYINGVTLKQYLQDGKAGEEVMRQAGNVVARIHKADVVHGDLTTSNIMVVRSGDDDKICMIDFGLSSGGGTEEDLAVDLYVLERAVIAAHSEHAQHLNDAFFEAYAKQLRRPAVLKRLEEVRARGRKRDMTG